MSDPPPEPEMDHAAKLELLNQGFRKMIPHNDALALEVIDFDARSVTMRLPYDPRWVGNPDTGVLHGGVLTTLLDAVSGASVFIRLGATTPIATLDLRVDSLKPASPGLAVIARAECYKLTRNVAFVRGAAYQQDASDPIATSTSTFMLHTKGRIVRPHP